MPQQISQDLQQGKRQKQISGTKKNGLDKTYGILFAHFLYLGILFVTFCHFFGDKVWGNLWRLGSGKPLAPNGCAIHDQCPCEYEPRTKRKPVDWVPRMVILPFLSFSFRKKIINPKFLKVFQSFLGVSRFQSHIFWPTNLEIWIQSFDHFPSDVTLADGALERGSVDQTGALWIACGICGKNGAFPPAPGDRKSWSLRWVHRSIIFIHTWWAQAQVLGHGIMAGLRAFPKAQASKLEWLV